MSMHGAAEKILLRARAALGRIEERRSTLDEELDSADLADVRRTVSHLLLSYFKHRRYVAESIASCIQRAPKPELRRLLELVFAQAVFQSGIAPESAVNVAVTLARRSGGTAAGFVNAVLRRALAERGAVPTQADRVFPEALLRVWRERYSREELDRMAQDFLAEPLFSFRLERDFVAPESWRMKPLDGFGPFRFGTVGSPETMLNSPEFAAGNLYVQDPATSLAASFGELGAVRAACDLCAAPGGKSLMLAERLPAGAQLVACDRSAVRQKLTRRNFELRGLAGEVRVCAAQELRGSFDLILADVPCSNTGVFRRRPDALWRFDAAAVTQIAALQREILEAAAGHLLPGGQLIYATCSLEPEENAGQVRRFAAEHPEFSLLRMEQLEPTAGHDGAFAALLVKNS